MLAKNEELLRRPWMRLRPDSIERIRVVLGRILIVLVLVAWHQWSVRYHDPDTRYTLEKIFRVLASQYELHIGLVLSTTAWGMKHPIIVGILLVPAVVISSFMVGYLGDWLSWLLVGYSIWTYFILFKGKFS